MTKTELTKAILRKCDVSISENSLNYYGPLKKFIADV